MNIRETIDTARDDYYIDIRSGDNGVVKSFPIAELRAELKGREIEKDNTAEK